MLTIIQQLWSMKQNTQINTNKSIYIRWNGPSVTKPNPENCKNCSSKCAYDCAQLQYIIQLRTVLIISPSYLQTNITAHTQEHTFPNFSHFSCHYLDRLQTVNCYFSHFPGGWAGHSVPSSLLHSRTMQRITRKTMKCWMYCGDEDPHRAGSSTMASLVFGDRGKTGTWQYIRVLVL